MTNTNQASGLAHKVNVLGAHVDTYRLSEMLDLIRVTVSTGQRLMITHANVHGLHLAYENPWFRDFLNRSDVLYCDGMGVKMAARLLGFDIPERYTLADWYPQLIQLAQRNHFSLFFLGNIAEVVESAAQNMRKDFPGLQIAGTQHGFFDKSPHSSENQAVRKEINALHPNILMVGMGMPVQEKWLMENWEYLSVNIAITCGAIFEYMAGVMHHGPNWMTQNYLEWLFRLIDRPQRYGKRYLRDNPLLLTRILRQKFWGLPF